MDGQDLVTATLWGIVFGLIGQGTRIVVALFKAWCTTDVGASYWTARRVFVTLAVGMIAGALATNLISWGEALEPGEAIGYIAAGYAGADFIEGVMTGVAPKTTPPSTPPNETS